MQKRFSQIKSAAKKLQARGVDFEKDHLLFERARGSKEYKKLVSLIRKCQKILIIGNGGLMDVSSHGAADLSRLIPGKSFYCFNNAGFLTSNANDFGFEVAFTRWLQTTVYGIENPATTLILGLSCSGNSANVLNALHWAQNPVGLENIKTGGAAVPGGKYHSFLISGIKSTAISKGIPELALGTRYFHTTEILVMKLFYDIVYKLGHHCPDIAGEINRKNGNKQQTGNNLFDVLGSNVFVTSIVKRNNKSGIIRKRML